MRLACRSWSSTLPRTWRTSLNENRSLMTIVPPLRLGCRGADSLVRASRGIASAVSQGCAGSADAAILFGIVGAAVRFVYAADPGQANEGMHEGKNRNFSLPESDAPSAWRLAPGRVNRTAKVR